MTSYIVIASTSVVLIDSSRLTSGGSAIVLISSQMPPGRTITVRDSLGYLSSPQSIIVSTTAGIRFMDGTSSLVVSQPYASMSFSSRDATTWNIINTFGFPLYNTIANVSTLAVSTLIGNSLTIGGTLSTTTMITNSLKLQSTSQVFGPLFVSTLVVGTQPSVQIPYETTPGYSAYIVGSAYITSTVTIGGNLQVGGGAVFGSSMTVAGNLTVNSGANINGNLTLTGNLLTQGLGTFECQTAVLNSSLVVVGSATVGSNLFVNSNVQVGQSTFTNNLQTSTIQLNTVGGYIQLGTNTVIRGATTANPGQTAFAVNAPIYTPFLSTSFLTANSEITTTVLEVLSTISAGTVTTFTLGSAYINNLAGSLVTGGIETNSITVFSSFTTGSIYSSSFVTSNLIASGSIQGGPQSYLSTGAVFTSSLQVAEISTGSIKVGTIETTAAEVSSLFISQSFTAGPGVSSINMATATIDNSRGSIYTGAVFTSSLTTSSIALQSGNIYTTNNLTISTPALYLQNIYTSTFNTIGFQTSTMNTSRLTIGNVPTNTGPNFSNDTAFPPLNILTTGGPGDYLTPYYLSNVVPVGQNPTLPYTTSIGFNANYFGSVPPGLLIGYSASLFWGGQTSSYLSITNGPSLYGVYGQDQTVTGTLTQSSFGIQATLYGSSAISVTFSFQYSPNTNSIDSNSYIKFNNGSLNWNYALNGTTIQNSLNDMSIRNVYYYGSLNFASDPRIKENISSANLRECYDTISALPLRKFKYISEYCSSFQVSEEPRLGFLATDLLPHFPKSVHISDTLFPAFSKELMTIDTSQVDMAHLGTTKYLIEEVKRLEEELSTIKGQNILAQHDR